MKNSSDIIGNLTRDLPACSAVPQPTVHPPVPFYPFPILRRTSSDSIIFLFRSDVGRRPTRFLLRLFALCRSLSDAFSHVVRILGNR
jgi:hypothetical protein